MHMSLKKALVAAVSVAGLSLGLAAPLAASAQPYDERETYRDRCEEQRAGHTVLGAVLGGIAGGVIGNQVSHGNGTGWGAAAGAAVGAGIGHSADCYPEGRREAYRGDRYGDEYYRDGGNYGDEGYYRDQGYDRGGYAYDGGAPGYYDQGYAYDRGAPGYYDQGYAPQGYDYDDDPY